MHDDEIEIDYGEDALQYLRFQRYIIGYLVFVMVLCVSVILPLNFMGDLQVSSIVYIFSVYILFISMRLLLYDCVKWHFVPF